MALPPTAFPRSAAVSAAAVAHIGASSLIPRAALTRARATTTEPAACDKAVAAISLVSSQSVAILGQAALGAQPLARPRIGRLPRWRRVILVPAVGAHAAGAVPRLRLQMQLKVSRSCCVLHVIGGWSASSQPPACMPPLPHRGCGCQ